MDLCALSLALVASFAAPVSTAASESSKPEATSEPSMSDFAGSGAGSPRLVERSVVAGMASMPSKTHAFLTHLTERFGPRLTGSTGLRAAERWTYSILAELGLDARLEPWGEVATGFDRGRREGRLWLAGGSPEELEFITDAWTPGTVGPARGRAWLEPSGVEPGSLTDDELLGVWVVRRRLGPSPERRRALEARYREAGALGIVVHGGRDDLLRMSGELPTVTPRGGAVRVRLLGSQHERLIAALNSGAEAELEFDIENHFSGTPVQLYNVVADLPGTDKADELVIVQAHLDSWDGADGAVDNGTGVATCLEVARLLQDLDLRGRRTIRFVLYSGEEQGLLGSRAWVEAHRDRLDDVCAVLNHDRGTNPIRGVEATPEMLASLERVFAAVPELLPDRPFEVREVRRMSGATSDYAPFLEAGVPAFHWLQDYEGYGYVHHTQHDTLEQVSIDDQEANARLIALTALALANLEEPLPRRELVRVAPRRLGARLEGTLLSDVDPKGQAHRAGLRTGDRVLAIDGTPVRTRREISTALQACGSRPRVRAERQGILIEVVLDYGDDLHERVRQRAR